MIRRPEEINMRHRRIYIAAQPTVKLPKWADYHYRPRGRYMREHVNSIKGSPEPISEPQTWEVDVLTTLFTTSSPVDQLHNIMTTNKKAAWNSLLWRRYGNIVQPLQTTLEWHELNNVLIIELIVCILMNWIVSVAGQCVLYMKGI